MLVRPEADFDEYGNLVNGEFQLFGDDFNEVDYWDQEDEIRESFEEIL